jgi:hypothetical protein
LLFLFLWDSVFRWRNKFAFKETSKCFFSLMKSVSFFLLKNNFHPCNCHVYDVKLCYIIIFI